MRQQGRNVQAFLVVFVNDKGQDAMLRKDKFTLQFSVNHRSSATETTQIKLKKGVRWLMDT